MTTRNQQHHQHTILVVDDEQTVRSSLARFLAAEGYRVVSAEDGRDALEVLSRTQVDVLISDLDMPELTGTELVLEVRRRHPDVVRILLTGHGTLESAMAAINQGEVHRYFSKSTKLAELLAGVREILARETSRRQSARMERLERNKAELLAEVERQHPGSCQVSLDSSGAYAVDARAVREMMALIDGGAHDADGTL